MNEAVHHHFTAAVQPLAERFGPAPFRDYRKALGYLQVVEHRLVLAVRPMPQQGAIDHCGSQGANSHLKGTAVPDQRTGVKPDQVIGG